MKNFLTVWLIVIAIILGGCCGNAHENKFSQKSKEEKEEPLKITLAEAQTKLEMLSSGLEIYHDDMKGFTLCRCHYSVAVDEMIAIVPCVIVYDKDYSVSLRQHVLYCGREPLHFDTLYIKTSEGVNHFKLKNVSILYGRSIVEEFNGTMDKAIYDKLKVAVSEGYARIRLEGRQMYERDLSLDELENFTKVFDIYEFFNSVQVQ